MRLGLFLCFVFGGFKYINSYIINCHNTHQDLSPSPPHLSKVQFPLPALHQLHDSDAILLHQLPY